MDPSQSNVGEGSKGQFPGGNNGHHSEADVEEVPAPTAKRRCKKPATRIKLSNFNPDEDKNLVKSWLEICCDPITCTGQKRDRMWERIIERYNSRRASNPVRSLKSLQSRWDRINAEVTLFASYYADSIQENPSGMSDADKTAHAVGKFADVLQHKFGFLHCWELMKDAPKWQDPNARNIATAARGEGFGEENTAGTDTLDHAEGQSSPVRSGAQATSPMGRDSAKAAKKQAKSDAGSTSSAEYTARMQDLPLQKNSIMQQEAVRKNDHFRMDPSQSNVGEGLQRQFLGGYIGAYQPGNPYMYLYQGPPGWFPPGFQPRPPIVAMMNPSGYAPEGFQQVQIPGAAVHHSEADVEEVPAPTAKRRGEKSATRTKLANFNPDEDKNLVKSWLEINCDPSTGQKRDRMWDRIIERYNSRRASNPARSLRSLQSRWDRINAEVTLFASYYADNIQETPSGMSDADKTTHAVCKVADVLQRKFGFLHCWELMKDALKWQDPNAINIATAARGEGFEEEITPGTDTVDHAEGQSSPVRSGAQVRRSLGRDSNARNIATAARGEGFGEEITPGTDTVDHAEGQSSPVRSGAQARRSSGRGSAKAAKKQAKSDAGSTSSAEYAARMQDLSLQKISIMQQGAVRKNDRFQQLASIDEKCFEEMRKHNEAFLQIEREKIQLMRQQQEDERIKEEKKEDERILKVDLDACTPQLRLYYQTLQEEILEKIAARRRRSQVPVP